MSHRIYLITNNKTGKHYVGYTSLSLEERLVGHLCAARGGSDYLIHQSIRKHGWENFSIKTIYESDDGDHTLKEMEPHFIKEYGSYGGGYNMTLGGEGISGPCSPEKAKKISEAKKGKSLPHMMGNSLQSNYIWVTNGHENIRLTKGSSIPSGFRRGRTNISSPRLNPTIRPKFPGGYKKSTKPRKPRTQEHRENLSKSLVGNSRAAGNRNVAGTIWVNNGIINRRVPTIIGIPEGFVKGKIK